MFEVHFNTLHFQKVVYDFETIAKLISYTHYLLHTPLSR